MRSGTVSFYMPSQPMNISIYAKLISSKYGTRCEDSHIINRDNQLLNKGGL